MKRRSFLKGTLSASATGLAVSTGLLTPGIVFAEDKAKTEEAAAPAAEGGADPFKAESVDAAMEALGGKPEESDKIKIKAPDIAENGAVVPITVTSEVEGTTSIAILASENPTPLAATFTMGEGAESMAATRIKMGKSGDVIALVTAGDKNLSAKKAVKVTIGGCGG